MINRIVIFYYYTPYATQATRQRFMEIKAHYGREYGFYLNVVCKYIDTHFCRYSNYQIIPQFIPQKGEFIINSYYVLLNRDNKRTVTWYTKLC